MISIQPTFRKFLLVCIFLSVWVCSFLLNFSAHSEERVEIIMPSLNVWPKSINVFSTPIAYYKKAVYTVNVESISTKTNGMDLLTVVRKGIKNENGIWIWTSKVVESRTLDDQYHTQASIGIDREGYIHVAYNMHNMPWQYAVSKKPEDISDFEFRGTLLTDRELYTVKKLNQSLFPEIGSAAIPGNQITYPAFFSDRNNDLYITYRFALYPARSWGQRGLAGGFARYDCKTKTWFSIGGPMSITRKEALLAINVESKTMYPFAFQDGWTVYLLRPFFDEQNNLHLSWTWREKEPGNDCSYPSYAFSKDNGLTFLKSNEQRYRMPASLSDADIITDKTLSLKKFYAQTSISVDIDKQPWILLSPIDSDRVLIHYDKKNKTWSVPEKTPFGASQIFIDDVGTQWAFASGLKIFQRNAKSIDKWLEIYSEKGFGYPSILPVPEEHGFLIHARSNDGKRVQISFFRPQSFVYKKISSQ